MPKPVYIAGIRYTYSTPRRVDSANSLGEAHYRRKSLKVRSGAGPIGLNTFIHEVIHISGRENTCHKKLGDLDERDVDVLANDLAGALRQAGWIKR